jgi:hypothetical protein
MPVFAHQENPLLVAIAAIASAIPAVHAMRIPFVEALRQE